MRNRLCQPTGDRKFMQMMLHATHACTHAKLLEPQVYMRLLLCCIKLECDVQIAPLSCKRVCQPGRCHLWHAVVAMRCIHTVHVQVRVGVSCTRQLEASCLPRPETTQPGALPPL